MRIPKKVSHQIRYLCDQISTIEWSGILMYKLVGNFATGNFYCVVKDIFLMDIGNSTYTEYEFSERFIKYRMENPESLDWEVAHIHSHAGMSTFFSGTDTQELQDNAPNHNYYLSLIVNNEFKPTAKIAFVGKQEKKESAVRSFFGDNGKLHRFKTNKVVEEDVLFVYNCDIKADMDIKVSDVFEQRLYEVVKEKEEAEAKRKAASKVKAATNISYKTPGVYNSYDTHTAFDQEAVAITKDALIEELLADMLLGQFDSRRDLEEALFNGNISYKDRGTEYIVECATWIRNMGPYMLGYSGEYDLKKEDLTSILEALFMYEDEFPELIVKLTEEILK